MAGEITGELKADQDSRLLHGSLIPVLGRNGSSVGGICSVIIHYHWRGALDKGLIRCCVDKSINNCEVDFVAARNVVDPNASCVAALCNDGI